MDKIKFGKTDLNVSRIGLGTLAFGHPSKGIQDKETIYDCLNFALDNGINLIDTAEEYSQGKTEQYIGDVLKERGDREDTVIVTKVSHDHLSYKGIIKAANKSLERLQTDYIDLYLLHWPWAYSPISESAKALDDLINEGKIRYVGISNFQNALVQELIDNLQNGDVIANEIEYNLVSRNVEIEILPYLRKQKIFTLAYYPLSSGFLTAKYDENTTFPEKDFRNYYELFKNKENFTIAKELFSALKQIAEKHEGTPAQVAINWLLKDDDVIPIPGAKSRKHIESNIQAAEWKLTKDEISQLTKISDALEFNWDRF
ncbi:MAG: aldo/keto reductase [Asgard group archaeon]|nr:aldo/keto reductase [Asgard group archaeon]